MYLAQLPRSSGAGKESTGAFVHFDAGGPGVMGAHEMMQAVKDFGGPLSETDVDELIAECGVVFGGQVNYMVFGDVVSIFEGEDVCLGYGANAHQEEQTEQESGDHSLSPAVGNSNNLEEPTESESNHVSLSDAVGGEKLYGQKDHGPNPMESKKVKKPGKVRSNSAKYGEQQLPDIEVIETAKRELVQQLIEGGLDGKTARCVVNKAAEHRMGNFGKNWPP